MTVLDLIKKAGSERRFGALLGLHSTTIRVWGQKNIIPPRQLENVSKIFGIAQQELPTRPPRAISKSVLDNLAYRAWHPESTLGKTVPRRQRRANDAVERAIRRGDLIKDDCARCGSGNSVHAHHESYDHPLDIIWLCPSCHKKRHIEMVAEGIVP